MVKPDEEHQDGEDHVLLVRTAAIFGVRAVVPFLNKVLNCPKATHYLRAQATYALNRAAAASPREVQSVVVPLFLNKAEEQDVRIAAFAVWFRTAQHVPTGLTHLKIIGKELLTETNRHVVTFAYSTLSNYADSLVPCNVKM